MQRRLSQEQNLSFMQGLRDMLPLSIVVIPWAILAGSAAIHAGMSGMQAAGMSAFVFAGAAQLVSLSMLMAGASLCSIVITVFFLTSQHFVYALSLRDNVKALPLSQRLSIGFLLTDELYAILMLKPKPSFGYMLGAGLSFYLCWVGFSVLGIVLANTVPDLNRLHFEFSIVAVFLVMAIMLIKTRAAACGVIASSFCVVLLHWLQVPSAIVLAGFAGMWAASLFEQAGR